VIDLDDFANAANWADGTLIRQHEEMGWWELFGGGMCISFRFHFR
jgi:hypothetical protein